MSTDIPDILLAITTLPRFNLKVRLSSVDQPGLMKSHNPFYKIANLQLYSIELRNAQIKPKPTSVFVKM